MGSSTDELIDLAGELSETPSPREMDMLLSAGERITMSLLAIHLNNLGHESFSLTGSQAGITTTSRHGMAEIENITGERVKEGIEKWIINWKKNGWKTASKKPVKNKELWMELDQQIIKHEITWEWVKGHAGGKYNEKADYSARRFIEEY